jgi:hypothetical protein
VTARVAIIALGLIAAIAGGSMYWLQVYAFYTRLPADTMLTAEIGGRAVPLAKRDFAGIDASSSPLRFRACFRIDPGLLAAARPAPRPVPLTAPYWFDCFDAVAIGRALGAGEARAVVAVPEVALGVDRLIAVFPDGRAYAWHQLNGTLE